MTSIAACLVSLALVVSWSAAQNGESVAGVVVDSKGVPVPAATVRLFPPLSSPPRDVLTETDGTFEFTGVPAGVCRLLVEMEGFQKLDAANLDSSRPASRRLRLTLQPPPVTGPAPVIPARNRAAPGTRGTGRLSLNEPLFREVELAGIQGTEESPLSALAPANEMEAGLPRADSSDMLVINGGPTASVDALEMNDPNSRQRMLDMARQMGFGAESMRGPQGRLAEGGSLAGFGRQGPMMGGGPGFGGFGGGGRGGAFRQSRINGSVYSTYGNSALNARPYSITGQTVPKALNIQNTFGATVGGSLPWGTKSTVRRMPRQQGMWFFSYGGSRNRNPFDVLTTVPTELEREGDFSQTVFPSGPLAGQPVVLYDPRANVPTLFPDAKIPSDRLDLVAAALLKYVPLPNLPGLVQNFTLQRGLVNASDQITARVNTPLTAKANFSVNYSLRRGDSINSQSYPGLDTDRTNRAENIGLGGMYRFKPRLVLNWRLSFNRVRVLALNPFAYEENVAGELGIEGVSQDPINYGVPNLNFTNYGDLQLSPASLSGNQTLTTGAGLMKIGTRHTLQAGGDISWNQRNTQQDTNARGTFEFTGIATSSFDPEGRPLAGTGYDLADFLLGLPYSTSRRFGSSINYLRNKSFNLFVQDNWRVRSNLTVSLGLRYEYIQPYYEKYDHIVNLDVAPEFAAVAQVFPDQSGPYGGYFPRSLLFTDRNNFGPRIGIAWKPWPSAPWVVRTGYGHFYNPSVYPYIVGQMVSQPPFAVGQDILGTPTSPLTLSNGFPVNPDVTILNTYAIDPHYRIGCVQQWSLNVQTTLFKIYAVEVGYNGSKGTRLDILRAPNRAPAGSSPGSTENDRVISDAGNFVYQSSGADSILHAMQVRVTRRFSGGLRMQGSYVLSKSIDDASGVGGGQLVVVQNDHDISAERSLSSFDQRHRFEYQFSLDLPFGERRRFLAGAGPLMQKFIAGWSLNGDYQLMSGTPLTARLLGNVSNNSGTGSNWSERPDSTGVDIALSSDQRISGRFFNTAAFAIPEPGLFGDAGRNTIPGPGTNLLTLALRKSFRLDDSNRRLDFNWQVSNVLNHPNFTSLGTIVNALDFGRVTGAGSMRVMVFNLRLNF